MQKRKTKKRDIGREILSAIDEVKTGGGRRYHMTAPGDVIKARSRLELTQADFASILGVSIRTLQAWEQGRRHPSGAALALLTIAAARPEVVAQVLRP